MSFASRTDWPREETAWSRAVAARRNSGLALLDLTASNPTQCGFAYDARLPAELSAPAAAVYDPDPRGILRAREAVSGYYADHAAGIDPHRIFLTTSTSEGYSRLFRLLCDPGDEVLIAQPSYPLFDLLAVLDDVRLVPYPLLYDPGNGSRRGSRRDSRSDFRSDPGSGEAHCWSLDLHTLRARIGPRTRAILVVHPNNPTGHCTLPRERAALTDLCRERGLALIVDEVFLDYPLPGVEQPQSFARGDHPALTFILSGLSKVAALPQMKASWIVCLGPEPQREEAMRRLEIVADTFLSMNAPVQHAMPGWIAGRHSIQQQLRERVARNLAALDHAIAPAHSLARPAAEAGWYAVLRTPPADSADGLAIRLIERHGVAAHPGSFFGFAERNRLVLSLLPPPETFAAGVDAIVAEARES